MNLEWVKNLNDEILLKRKALENYYNERNKDLSDAIDRANLIRQKAIVDAKLAMRDAFQKNK